MRRLYYSLPLCACLLLAGPLAAQRESKTTTPARKKEIPGIVLYNPANNHYYQSFSGSIKWLEAKRKAAEHSYLGAPGHLATITSKEEYDFVVNGIFVYDYWIGGYRDERYLSDPRDHGWRWVTGEPFVYANWNEGSPNNAELKPHQLSFWTGSQKWSPHPPDENASGYLVEYEPKVAPKAKALTASQEVDKFLSATIARYSKMTSYQATVTLNFKAFQDTVENYKAKLMLMADGRFRLEGKGENGKLLAICDGKRLMLSTIPPGERMKFVVKPMPPLPVAMREAMSLLTSSPKAPSIIDIITGAFDKNILTSKAIIGGYVEGDLPEQTINTTTSVQMGGDSTSECGLFLSVSLADNLLTASHLSFRYKAYPYTVRETHSDIKINEEIPGNNFVLVITVNSEQVDNLGEGDEVEMVYSLPKK